MDFDSFDLDRDDIINEMKEKNIITLTNTLNLSNYNYTRKLFNSFKEVVKVCPGLYPQDAQDLSDEDFKMYLDFLRKNKDKFLAIGEVGLDKKYTKDVNMFNNQVEKFKKLIELGLELDKPLIIHTRQAESEVLNILEEYINKFNFRKFILHCFSGKKKLISKIKDMNIYVSIPLTVLNTESFQFLVREIAIGKIFAETDSPFLNPSKERNSPLNIKSVYNEIAKIKGLDPKEVENIIYRNYMNLFM